MNEAGDIIDLEDDGGNNHHHHLMAEDGELIDIEDGGDDHALINDDDMMIHGGAIDDPEVEEIINAVNNVKRSTSAGYHSNAGVKRSSI